MIQVARGHRCLPLRRCKRIDRLVIREEARVVIALCLKFPRIRARQVVVPASACCHILHHSLWEGHRASSLDVFIKRRARTRIQLLERCLRIGTPKLTSKYALLTKSSGPLRVSRVCKIGGMRTINHKSILTSLRVQIQETGMPLRLHFPRGPARVEERTCLRGHRSRYRQ